MAELINVTPNEGIKNSTYGQIYPLEKEISLIGSDPDCDIVLQLHGNVSRQHAFIIQKEDSFYVGDISRRGTYLHLKRPLFGYYAKAQLLNTLEASCVKDAINKDKGFRFKRAESTIKGTFDYMKTRRDYLLEQFLKEEDAINKLLGQSLLKLGNRDIIEIYPGFMLKFKK